jgi:pimeloyl-ACP methyl ester carboxylesterase
MPHWIGRVAALLAITALVIGVGAAWIQSNTIRSEFLVPRPAAEDYDLEVLRIGAGRVVLPRTDGTVREGTWGLESETAYAQVSNVLGITESEVERSIVTLSGELAEGDRVRFDADAFFGDPQEAHGFGFDEVRVPGELGPHPAWLIEGRRSTWVVIVHDIGTDQRSQALRVMPMLLEQGFPILVISVRNDEGAPASESRLRSWGLDEWRDLEAALTLAERKGAADYVLYGYGMGAEIISTFLHESEDTDVVRGVVLDSPVLDLEGTVDATSAAPAPLQEVGQHLARLRFGLEWDLLDQIERTDQFDVPMLVLHGAGNQSVPISFSEAFVAALPELARLERFEQAAHGDLWNTDSARYEQTVVEFLDQVAGPE